jgi:glycosyltransferase involved in cell wall biosynthesis
MSKVLFLASWYPSKVDLFDGDFIERHAKSASLYNQVFVIYVVKDPTIKDGKITVNKQITGNLISYKCYYPKSKSKLKWIEKIHSNIWMFKLQKRIFKKIVEEYGMPDIVHLNVLMKAGVFARWLYKKHKLYYVLSEHWTGYYPERKDDFLHHPFLYKFLSKKIYRNCLLPLPVTEDLGKRMNQTFGIEKGFIVIPNVVDTNLFYPDFKNKNVKKRFIHISTLGYNKNFRGILNAIEKLYKKRKDFELYIAGSPSKDIVQWVKDKGLFETCIFFTGVISYEEVAEQFRKADALIMFSRYENLPCVILEALCSGLPVITTDVGGIREVINEKNGILIPAENENELLAAAEYLLENLEKYNKESIASSAQKIFNYEIVGKQFDEVYKTVISLKKKEN